MTTELDDLIRGTLAEDAPAAPPDDELADRVMAAGRRVRRTRRLALATAAVVAGGAGLALGLAAVRPAGLTAIATQPPAASPSPRPTTGATASPGTPDVKDVSRLGEDVGGGELQSYFVSPTGNLWCRLSMSRADCWALSYAPGAQPTGCPEGGPQNTVYLDGRRAAHWGCQHDLGGSPFLDQGATGGVAWWDPTIGTTAASASDSGSTLAVLRYGKSLVAGAFRCSMATTSVRCDNARTGHGFRLSASGATLT